MNNVNTTLWVPYNSLALAAEITTETPTVCQSECPVLLCFESSSQ